MTAMFALPVVQLVVLNLKDNKKRRALTIQEGVGFNYILIIILYQTKNVFCDLNMCEHYVKLLSSTKAKYTGQLVMFQAM